MVWLLSIAPSCCLPTMEKERQTQRLENNHMALAHAHTQDSRAQTVQWRSQPKGRRREEGSVFSRLTLMPFCHLPAHGCLEHLGFLSETPSQGSPLVLDPTPPVNSRSQPSMDPGLCVAGSRFLKRPSPWRVRAARYLVPTRHFEQGPPVRMCVPPRTRARSLARWFLTLAGLEVSFLCALALSKLYVYF